jgi:hypothetical protein
VFAQLIEEVRWVVETRDKARQEKGQRAAASKLPMYKVRDDPKRHTRAEKGAGVDLQRGFGTPGHEKARAASKKLKDKIQRRRAFAKETVPKGKGVRHFKAKAKEHERARQQAKYGSRKPDPGFDNPVHDRPPDLRSFRTSKTGKRQVKTQPGSPWKEG